MSSMELICPAERCLYTFPRNLDLKVHINDHLCCHWYRCPFCPKCYLHQANALAHLATCASRNPGISNTLRECFDARYPLLRVWSMGMELPRFKADGSGDAEMIVRHNPEQVWECAKGSRQVTFRQTGVGEEASSIGLGNV